MALNNYQDADFTPDITPSDVRPNMGTYNSPQTFRFWCQKVLPLVYDNSLSYYELLCKVVDYLNKTMEDVNTAVEDVTNLNSAFGSLENHINASEAALLQAYTDLQSYVNNYFNNLDVQEEINNKLDAMVADGTLDAILLPYFNAYTATTDARINAKFDEQDDLLESTLATQNNAIDVLESRMDTFSALQDGSTTGDAELADIRVADNGWIYSTAGDAVRAQAQNNADTTSNKTGIESIDYTYGGYIAIESPTSFTPIASSIYKYAIVDCAEGDVFTINGSGAPSGSARLWGFTKADGTYVLRSGINLTAENLVLTAPEGAEKLIINDRANKTSFYGVNIVSRLSTETTERTNYDNSIDDSVGVITGNDRIDMTKGAFYAYNASAIDISAPRPYAPWDCALVPCSEGDLFTINGTGSGSIRLWAFVDSIGGTLCASAQNRTAVNDIIEAPANAAYLVLNDNSGKISYKGKLADYRITKNNESYTNITGNKEIEYHYGGYINVYSSPVSLTPTFLPTHKYAIVDCQAGDMFTVNGRGAEGSGSDRVWCFIDADNTILTRASGGGYTAVNELLTAPVGAVKLILCDKTDSISYYGQLVDSKLKLLEKLTFANNIAYDLFKPYKCRMKAHRGNSYSYVQNTIRAFEAAGADPNFYGIETDIRATSDGVLICYHDNDLSTLTDGEGVIDFTPYSTVSTAVYDYGGPTVTYPNEHIALFSDYLKICRKYGKVPFIEIKTSMKNTNLQDMVDMIEEMGFTGRCVYTSQSLAKIKALRTITDVDLIEYCIAITNVEETIASVEGIKNIYFGVPVTSLTENMVNALHNNGYLVDAFDLNVGDQATYDTVIEYGVEGFLVNSLDGLNLY